MQRMPIAGHHLQTVGIYNQRRAGIIQPCMIFGLKIAMYLTNEKPIFCYF